MNEIEADKLMTKQSVLDIIEEGRKHSLGAFQSSDDIVDYIRAVRDGGDLSPWLGNLAGAPPSRQ